MDIAMFPGQGAQRLGMGGQLFDEVEEFVAVRDEVDRILGYSIKELCLSDPQKRLGETQFTQPALYIVNAIQYMSARAAGLSPRLFVGHSLGEYNALHAAGAFDFLTGLRLVKKRGELMGQAKNGAMAAVVGLQADRIGAILRDNDLEGLDVANFNSAVQTVISGPSDLVKKAGPVFEASGAEMYIPLPVSAAFHSRYMAPAAAEFTAFLADFQFQPTTAPVISNVTARPYRQDDAATHTPELLSRQITSSVRWTDSVRYMRGRAGGTERFVEVGPGNILSRLVQ